MSRPVGSRIGRYLILDSLGAGGMGEVYRARDERLGREVALKLLPEAALENRRAAARLFREARTASALDHPNIVTIHDIGESGPRCYVVMELIRGRTLRQVLAEGVTLPTLAHLGSQVARGLASAHRAGVVHRDIKPQNIMVRDDGHVKVVDFGLARPDPLIAADSAGETLTDTHRSLLVGTYRYMSPEQARGKRVSTATDLFSLGIVLYEGATARHPFEADAQLETLRAIVSQPVVSPTSLAPGIPDELETLLLQMLDKRPEARPTADEAEAVLKGLAAGQVQVALRPRPRSARRIVGRDRERAELHERLQKTAAGGLFVGVTGEPGRGKTSLIEEFLSDLEEVGQAAFIGRGRCAESLASVAAYLPVLEALETLLRDDVGGELEGTMKLLAPTWHRQISPSTASSSDIRSASQAALRRELVAFLAEASRQRPLILFLDDAQWADASTVDLLGYLGHRLDSIRVLFLLAYRLTELRRAGPPFLGLKLDLQSRGVLREIALPLLSREDIEEFVELQFPGHRLPAEFLQMIHLKTEGNPLFLADVVRDLSNRGIVDSASGRWELVRDPSEIGRELPESVRSMIELKITRLEDDERHLLACAAVRGSIFESAIVARALEQSEVGVEEQLETLEAKHAFVRQVGEQELPDGTTSVRYRFAHALYREAFERSVVPSRKASLAGELAETLLAAHGEKSEALASELALLFETAREPVRAMPFYLAAAQHAAALFANQEAVSLCRKGLALLDKQPAGPERDGQELGFLLALGSPLMSTEGYGSSGAEQAFARAGELSKQLGDPSLAFMMADALAVIKAMRADYAQAREIAEELLGFAKQSQHPTVETEAHWVMGSTLWSLGEFVDAREQFASGVSGYDIERVRAESIVYAVDPAVCCHTGLATTSWLLGSLEEAEPHAEEAVILAQDLEHPESLALALFAFAMLGQLRQSAQETRSHAGAAMAIANEHGLAQILAWSTVLNGWGVSCQEEPEEGLAQMRQGLAAQDAMGAENLRPYFLGLVSDGLENAGRPEEGLAVLDEALGRVEATGERNFEAELHRQRAQRLAALDNRPDGEASLERAIVVARGQGARLVELRSVLALARLRQGRKRDYEALQAVYSSFTQGLDLPDLVAAREALQEMSS